ncbi:hypothetical protein, partial [Actinomycetospora atypica]
PGGGGGGAVGGGAGTSAANTGGAGGGGGSNLVPAGGTVAATNAGAGSVTVTYAVPVAVPASVRGDVRFGADYRLSIDVRGGTTSGSGSCALNAGDYRALCRSITSVTRIGGTATITGTALNRTGAVVPFTATIVDGSYPGGTGVDTASFTAGGQTLTGSVYRGDIQVG